MIFDRMPRFGLLMAISLMLASRLLGQESVKPAAPSATRPNPPANSPADLIRSATGDVDVILRRVWKQAQVVPAEDCGDGVYLRRVTLDLLGRTPKIEETKAFLADPDREALVSRLVNHKEFSGFWSESLATQWCGHRRVIFADREVLRIWLEQAIQDRTPYDEIARAVIAAEGEAAVDGAANFLLRNRDQAATKLTRLFLGVRLDCAQCHDHPFDRWTQADHDQMERFFAGMRVTEVSEGNYRLASTTPPNSQQKPRFLTGATARTNRWRDEFSLFTIRSKPFARTFANRMWYHFLGRGIVHPIDDFSEQNPPVSRELLERLAQLARETQFDLRAMCRAVCATEAYQRSSAADADRLAQRTRVFAVRTIKPLMFQQHVAAIEAVTGESMASDVRRRLFASSIGETLDEDFSRLWEHEESAQSIMTRLTLPDLWRPQRTDGSELTVDDLYLQALSRHPTAAEREICADIPLTELAYALIHGGEFCVNH